MSDRTARASASGPGPVCSRESFLLPSMEVDNIRKSGPADDKVFDLPDLSPPFSPLELFNPEKHLPRPPYRHNDASRAAPPLPLALAARANPGLSLVPREEDCRALWDRYGMLENIRVHSLKVADFAYAVARAAVDKGVPVMPEAVFASGLLHDLGKTHTIHHGGNHAQIGAAWTMLETRNGPIARGVIHHVHWPFAERFDDDELFLVLAVIYADKRTRHDCRVSLDERFADLLDRYGVNEYARTRIGMSHEQGKRIEAALSRRLGVNLDEYTADCGRLVKRT